MFGSSAPRGYVKRWLIGAAVGSVVCACASPPSEPLGTDTQPAERAATEALTRTRPPSSPDDFRRALSPRLSRSGDGLTARRTATGSTRVDFEGRFRHVTVMSRGADGQLRERCVSSVAELDTLLDQNASRP
jgi:hypothetical protein